MVPMRMFPETTASPGRSREVSEREMVELSEEEIRVAGRMVKFFVGLLR